MFMAAEEGKKILRKTRWLERCIKTDEVIGRCALRTYKDAKRNLEDIKKRIELVKERTKINEYEHGDAKRTVEKLDYAKGRIEILCSFFEPEPSKKRKNKKE